MFYMVIDFLKKQNWENIPEILSVFVYGSVARGEAEKEISDLDE